MSANVWIVIVNYRTAGLAVDCLRSLATQRSEMPAFQVVVVDNDSGDGSVETLANVVSREKWDAWVSITPSGRNGGFAFGNNVGIRRALDSPRRVDYVMLLNPDTVAHSGAVRALVEFMELNPKIGIAGSRLENGQGGAECSAHNAPSPMGELLSGANLGLLSRVLDRYAVTPPMQEYSHPCEWVSGASLMVRREVFETMGFLDEGFFLYFEEVDFCARARKAGWEIWFASESRIVHLEGAATGIQQVARRRPRYWYDSRRRYFVKHFGIFGLILADGLWAAGRLSLAVRSVLRLGKGSKLEGPKWYTFDILWGDLRFLMRGGRL
jgi:N-acetylglucosaminyl-diphospho-decaprenol L-rhamnosyltransferase